MLRAADEETASSASDNPPPAHPRPNHNRRHTMPPSSKPPSKKHPASANIPPRPKKRSRGKPRAEKNTRESTLRSLDNLGLRVHEPVVAAKPSSAKRKGKKKIALKRKPDEDDGGASSGDEYTGNLLETYIGQIGACGALGWGGGDVTNLTAWENFSEEERESLRVHLPPSLSEKEKEETARMLVSGHDMYFGSPRDRIFKAVAAGLTHPRVRRWRLRVTLIERRHHLLSMREYHNRSIRRLLARKACDENAGDNLAGLAAVGGNLTGSAGALQALPGRIQATAEAAARSSIMKEWDANRWIRVLDFRIQETQRYKVPEKAFRYMNPWGHSIVGPLKRGPALDGGRPREHVLLRNERPSHVTILCIVRDAASRLPNNRGTRADICDLLKDSQYVREGATFAQLNTVVSGALDRLHYEESAPVRYDAESKEWCYLHNNLNEEDFERPAWARETSQRQGSAVENAAMAVARSKPKKKKKKKAE